MRRNRKTYVERLEERCAKHPTLRGRVIVESSALKRLMRDLAKEAYQAGHLNGYVDSKEMSRVLRGIVG